MNFRFWRGFQSDSADHSKGQDGPIAVECADCHGLFPLERMQLVTKEGYDAYECRGYTHTLHFCPAHRVNYDIVVSPYSHVLGARKFKYYKLRVEVDEAGHPIDS